MSDENELRKIINDSGFPLQIRVAAEIEATKENHCWEIIAEELPWQDQHSDRGGYADLVLGRGYARMVIECKRSHAPAWVFLLPNIAKNGNDDLHARCMWIKGPDMLPLRESSHDPIFRSGWFNFYPNPSSYVAEYCAVKGIDKDKPMLERIAGQLIEATEALAIEEIMLSTNDVPGRHYVYVPVIVTNVDLQVCRFKTDKIELSTGQLSSGEFESVPFIRFSKSLTTRPTSGSVLKNLKDASQDKIRTVLVVNAEHLTNLLQEWRFGPDHQPPWGTVPRFE